MAAKMLYREMSGSEWRELSADYLHGAHAMFYAEWPGKFMDKYEYKYAVMMQVRFDGTLGFPGGLVDAGESPEEAVSREVKEEASLPMRITIRASYLLETGHNGPELQLTMEDHMCTHSSPHTKLCLHFFTKQLTLEQLCVVESAVPRSSSWGGEVLGVLRAPLYTLPNGLGLPAFLRNQFIGSSQQQLLTALERRGLLGRAELEEALRVANVVNTVVTKEDIQY